MTVSCWPAADGSYQQVAIFLSQNQYSWAELVALKFFASFCSLPAPRISKLFTQNIQCGGGKLQSRPRYLIYPFQILIFSVGHLIRPIIGQNDLFTSLETVLATQHGGAPLFTLSMWRSSLERVSDNFYWFFHMVSNKILKLFARLVAEPLKGGHVGEKLTVLIHLGRFEISWQQLFVSCVAHATILIVFEKPANFMNEWMKRNRFATSVISWWFRRREGWIYEWNRTGRPRQPGDFNNR